MSLPRFRWWYLLFLVPVGLMAAWWINIQLNTSIFRYRLTIDIEADGKVHSASSVIEVKYLLGYDGLKNWNAQVTGVAPIIDLGTRGTIIAGLDFGSSDYARKNREAGKVFRIFEGFPLHASEIPLRAFQLAPKDIHAAQGKSVLTQYPVFIWIPWGGNWTSAQQLFPDELQTAIHPSVALVQASIERLDRYAPIVTKVDPAPQWLSILRHDQRDGGCTSQQGSFSLCHHSMIERKGGY
jgi:hypothetical protein